MARKFHRIFSNIDPLQGVLPGAVRLLINGEQAFPRMFQAISEAQHFILVQYYILRQDRLGIELKDLLIRKAREGVAIYLLIDDWGSFGLGQKYVQELQLVGVKVERFLPFGLRFNFQINFRNHRKLVFIDGVVAFTGGLNVGNEYIGSKKELFWRDTHLELSGPCLAPLIEGFLEDWFFASRDDIRGLISYANLSTPLAKAIPVQILNHGPTDSISSVLQLFCHALAVATERVIIATPYFIPDTILSNALVMAALRGVKITLLVPRVGDNFLVHLVSLVHAENISDHVDIYLYTKGFMHQKVALIDDQLVVLGTANFDNRSMYLNFETMVVIHDTEFATKVSAMLEEDLRYAQIITEVKAISPVVRPFSRLIRLLGPLF